MLSLIVLSLLTALNSKAFWLPPERLVIDAKPQQVYVMQESDSDFVIYSPAQRAVLRIKKSQVTERQYCASKHANPIFRRGADARPSCPKAGPSITNRPSPPSDSITPPAPSGSLGGPKGTG